MSFTAKFGGDDGYNHVVELDVPTLAAAKREFYRSHARFGGVFWVRFTEVLPPRTAFDAALGKGREPVTSFHVLSN